MASRGQRRRGCFCGSQAGIVVVGDRVPRLFSCFYPVAGVTLWPFIFVSSTVPPDSMRVMVNHERIHICQANEMLVVFFYLQWVAEFLIGLCRYGSAEEAYLHISLECEAHSNEEDMSYCTARRLFGWRFYLRAAGYPGLEFRKYCASAVIPSDTGLKQASMWNRFLRTHCGWCMGPLFPPENCLW